MAPSLREGKLWFQTVKSHINWSCVTSCLSGGFGKYIYAVPMQ